MKTFLNSIYNQSEQEATINLYDKVHSLISEKNYGDVNKIFRFIDFNKAPLNLLVGLLVVTLAYNQFLDHRCMYYYKLEKFLGNGKDYLLRGLM